MPANSIDTFFACTTIVSVALIVTAFFAGNMNTRIDSFQHLNEDDYLQKIADQIVLSCGKPVDWGTNLSTGPQSLGLSMFESYNSYELDIDKICRLNSQNAFALRYLELSRAARLSNLALGVTISQFLDVQIAPYTNFTSGDITTLVFKISVLQSTRPVTASLRGYVISVDHVDNVSSETTDSGIGYLNVQMPSSTNGSALLVVFARALFDERITAYSVYSFVSSNQQQMSNGTFLELSPLNHTLYNNPIFSKTTVEHGFALTYDYKSSLNTTLANNFEIPDFADRSPIVLTVFGQNDSDPFAEWTAYPQIPLQAGANFENSEQNVFTYVVTIGGTLYRLDLSFGGVTQ
jgi:hypothetical protein